MSDTHAPLWPGMEGLEHDAQLHLNVGALLAKLEQTRSIRDRFREHSELFNRWDYRCLGTQDSIEALIRVARG